MASARAMALRATIATKQVQAIAIRDRLRDIVQARRGSYRAATNPRSRVQTPMGGSADTHADDIVRRLTRELSRDLDRNAGPFQTLNDKVEEYTVGGGVRVRAKTSNTAWNRKADALYHGKMKRVTGGIDTRQMRSGYRLQGLLVRHLCVDGDVGFLKLDDGTGQIIEADQIDGKIPANAKKPRGSTVFSGVNLSASGEALGFVVSPYLTGGGGVDYGKSELYGPGEFLFTAFTDRNSQTRGMPKLKAVLDDFERADSYVESEVIAAENGAQVFIKFMYPNGKNPTAPFTPGADAQNDRQLRGGLDADGIPDWQPSVAGSALVCPDGMIAEGHDPKRPNLNIEPFLIFLLRGYCAAIGYAYEFVFGDLRAMSWSVAKTLVDLTNNATERFQESHLAAMFSAIYLWQIRRFIDEGLLEENEEWDQHEHQWPRLAQPDDQKFYQSNLAGFQSGQTSRQRVFGAKAFEIMDELSKEREHACMLARALTEKFPEFPTTPEHFLGAMPAGTAPVDPKDLEDESGEVGVNPPADDDSANDDPPADDPKPARARRHGSRKVTK